MSQAVRRANRLVHEKSPYLLQHAHNPVDWYAWGDEAFARARAEDRPIFLSIGYSTCHWCHVMERESFEDEAVAALLNRDFVCIKVDREERPDVDRLHMTAMQAMGMGGGWPLTAFLTPQLKPFYGGTYFPPRSVPGRIGMLDLLPRIAEAWREQRAALEESGEHVLTMLTQLSQVAASADDSAFAPLLASCADALARAYDAELGGFGRAPKFPSTANLDFLLRWWAREPAAHADARAMVRRQLDAMQAGGIHDHLGGGFHRYSTDREWLVPHFEKMLYDQALIADAYLDAYQAAGDPAYAATARGIFAYVERDLSSDGGGFDSAEDADSEGEEGRFYVWTPADLEAALGADDAQLFARHYGVTPGGNFEHETSILNLVEPIPAALAPRLTACRAKLLAVRGTRVRPYRDDKVITAWNGLMIGAFAHGARVLHEPALAARAARAADFVWTQLREGEGAALKRRWRDGEAAGAGQLDDHAYYAHALLELYAATYDPRWLERAAAVTEAMLERFWDPADGACFESPAGDASVAVRMKDGFDGAELAGNSVAAANLVRLAGLLERPEWREKALATLRYYAARLTGNAWAMPRMLVAMDLASSPLRHIVIRGEDSPARAAMLAVCETGFRPFDERLVVDAATEPLLAKLAPFAAALPAESGTVAAYVCIDHACRLPVHDPAALVALLEESEVNTGRE